MDDQTIFYVLGLGLVALALVVSFAGLRSETFPPSRPVLLAGIGAFVLLVGSAAAFAWRSASDEQANRNAEIAAGELPSPQEVQDEIAAGNAEALAEAQGQAPSGGSGGEGTQTASIDAASLFEEQGCASCHTLQAAGATGTIGPDLDTALRGEDTAFIEESIVDPGAEIEEGFGPSMPTNFADALSSEELQALVQYLAESVGVKG